MKKTTKDELTNRINDLMVDFWCGLLEVVDPDCSLDEMHREGGLVYDVENYVEKYVVKLFDDNGFVADGDFYKATAFYTGGGIWLCAKHLDENHYAVVDNEDDLCLTYYINDEEEQEYYDLYPCVSVDRSVSLDEMTADDLVLWRELKTALDKAKH